MRVIGFNYQPQEAERKPRFTGINRQKEKRDLSPFFPVRELFFLFDDFRFDGFFFLLFLLVEPDPEVEDIIVFDRPDEVQDIEDDTERQSKDEVEDDLQDVDRFLAEIDENPVNKREEDKRRDDGEDDLHPSRQFVEPL